MRTHRHPLQKNRSRWTRIAALPLLLAAALMAGCNGEVEMRYVNVEGYEPGVKYHSTKSGYRLTGIVGPEGEITIEYKGRTIAHETGLKPGEEFEMFVDDPWVIQVPKGAGVISALARSSVTGAVYPLIEYELSDLVANLDGEFTAEPGYDLVVLGFDFDTTPDGDYQMEVYFSGLEPGLHSFKWILAGLVESGDSQALFPVEPNEYNFASVQSWPYVYDVHVVRPDIHVLNLSESAALPDPAQWVYLRVELEGAETWDVDTWGVRATHDVPGGAMFYCDGSYGLWGDDDADGIADVLVRFDRFDLAASLPSGASRMKFEGDLFTPFWNGWQSVEWVAPSPQPLEVSVLDPEWLLERGESLDWTFDVSVPSPGGVVTDFWYEITLPDSSFFLWEQFLGVHLVSGFQYQGPWGISVPRNLAPGSYRVDAVFGDRASGLVYSAGGFPALAP